MRAPTAISVGLLAFALVLGACSADQQAPTAPSTTPSLFSTHKAYTFGLTCTNAGTSTVAQVTYSVSPTVSGNFNLRCGQSGNLTTFKSFDYQITLTDQSDTPAAVCVNTRPIRNPGSITCQNATGTSSATLTVS